MVAVVAVVVVVAAVAIVVVVAAGGGSRRRRRYSRRRVVSRFHLVASSQVVQKLSYAMLFKTIPVLPYVLQCQSMGILVNSSIWTFTV